MVALPRFESSLRHNYSLADPVSLGVSVIVINCTKWAGTVFRPALEREAYNANAYGIVVAGPNARDVRLVALGYTKESGAELPATLEVKLLG
jgi:hypothetical protein